MFSTCIKGVHTYDDYSGILYNIKSKDDFNLVFGREMTYRYHYTDWNERKPGWYIYYVIDGGDGPNEYNLYNLNAYIEEQIKSVIDWRDELMEKIGNAT